jgi:flagellar protein FliS
MNGYQTYQKQQQSVGGTRIDLLLALFDGAIRRSIQAEDLIRAGKQPEATALLAKVQLIVSELAAGVRTDVDTTNGENLLRLYEFVVHQLSLARVESVAQARKILQTLHEGFESIRKEAVELERRGALASSDKLLTVMATA